MIRKSSLRKETVERGGKISEEYLWRVTQSQQFVVGMWGYSIRLRLAIRKR